MSVTQLGRQWCAYIPPATVQLSVTPSQTKALPAGPAVTGTAIVKNGSAPAAGKGVSITLSGGGTLGGITDANGKFVFKFIPPGNQATATLTANCTECLYTVQANVSVDPASASCSAADFANDAGSLVGNPISPATGSKVQVDTDFADNAPHALGLTRQYRSTAGLTAAGFASGNTWSHNYAASLTLSPDGNQATVLLGDGSSFSFTRLSPNYSWVPSMGNPNHRMEEINPLQYNDAGAQVYTSGTDDTRYRFAITGGKVQAILQRNGWRMNLAYLPAGPLASATNAFGRSLGFAYNTSGQLASITQPDGKTLAYSYDSAARLVQVAYPGGGTKTYLYENAAFPQALTGIVDENNQRLATFAYDPQGRATSSSHAGGAQNTSVGYPSSAAVPPQGSLVAADVALSPALFQSTVQITDALGNPYSVSYQGGDGFVRVLGSNSPVGGSGFALRAMSGSLPSSETDFLGIATFFSWDTARRLKTGETRAAGRPEAQTTSTQWHATFRLPTLTTEPGKTTTSTYDTLGNKLSQTETDTTGGPSNGQTRTWAWTYNPQGLPSTATDPLGRTTSFTYDSAGNLASLTNALGQASSYSYDGAGRMTGSAAPNGLQTSYAYDPRGRLLQLTIGANLGSNVAAAQQETNYYTYLPSGQLVSVQLPSGFKVNYSYDAAQRLVGAVDNRGNSISYTLDAMGNRVREEVKDPSGAIAWATTRSINALNRVATIQNGSLNTSTLAYDANGEQTGSTDALNQTTRQNLDGLRRPTATTFADNAVATQSWNAQNQITQATDPKGVATSYTKNAWGEVLQESSPDSGTTSYQRDAVGNVSSKTDARGQTTSYSYDALDRVTQATLADGKLQTFTWDGTGTGAQTGYLKAFSDASGSTSYERDSFGRITKKTQNVNDNPSAPTNLTTRYSYTNGQLGSITYPSGMTVLYQRAASGLVSDVQTQRPATNPLRTVSTLPLASGIAYNGLNQPTGWLLNCITGPLYTPSSAICDKTFRRHDTAGRVTATEVASLTYDAASRVNSLDQLLWASQTSSSTDPVTGVVSTSTSLYPTHLNWNIGYDSRNRITSFTRPGSEQSFAYDANGNRTASSSTKRSDTDLDGEFDATDRAQTTSQSLNIASDSNRLLGFAQSIATSRNGTLLSTVNSSVSYSQDAAGNQLTDGLRKFDYNSENRHSKTGINDSDEGAKAFYLYNALGQRVFKSEPQVDYTAPNETTLGLDFISWLKANFKWLFATAQSNASLGSSYAYADPSGGGGLPAWALLGEYNNGAATGSGRTEYIWLPLEDGSALPIAMFRNNRYWNLHSDHLGTPRYVTDDAGKPVWQLPYSAFGDNKPSGVLAATTNPNQAITAAPLLKATAPAAVLNLRFPGQYFDSETNLNYNYFRNYQPTQGRYTQFDPIGLDGGLNRFGYVGGNPLGEIDPLGLMGFGGGTQGKSGGFPAKQINTQQILPNGNYIPGFTPQDGICTLPGILGSLANSSTCTTQCCKAHDECYARNGCNSSSWQGNIPGGFKGACQQCNSDAANCVVSSPITGCNSCAK